MKLFICGRKCLHQVLNYLDENYYYTLFEIKDSPQIFLSLFSSVTYCVINEYNDGFLNTENMDFLPDETYPIALYIKPSNLQVAVKLKEDNRIKRLYGKTFDFLPIKNCNNIYKFYYYAFVRQDKKPHIALLVEHDGYGDCIMIMALIRKWIDTVKPKDVELTVYHFYEASYHLSHLFLPDCRNLMYMMTDAFTFLDNTVEITELEKIKESHVMEISNSRIRSAFTKPKEVANMLKLNYDHSLLDFQLSYWPIPKDIKQKIQKLKEGKKYIIGVQFYTSHDELTYIKRSYSAQQTQKFISLCHENNIGVINLSDYPKVTLGEDLNVSQLNINEIFSVVKEIDLFVGIDSCCGHIAGVLKKNNLIILGRVIHNISQRPYSMNHTIISSTGNIDTIRPESILETVKKILTKQLVLNPNIQEVYDYTFDVEYI